MQTQHRPMNLWLCTGRRGLPRCRHRLSKASVSCSSSCPCTGSAYPKLGGHSLGEVHAQGVHKQVQMLVHGERGLRRPQPGLQQVVQHQWLQLRAAGPMSNDVAVPITCMGV